MKKTYSVIATLIIILAILQTKRTSLDFLQFLPQVSQTSLATSMSSIVSVRSSNYFQAFFFNNREKLSKLERQHFETIGITQFLALSGFHLSLIVSLVAPLTSQFLSRKQSGIVLSCLVLWYCYSLATSPSLLRASIQMIFSLIGRLLLFKRVTSIVSLSWVVFLATVLELELLESVGMQLSIVATGSIILFPRYKPSSVSAWLIGEGNLEQPASLGVSTSLHQIYNYCKDAYLLSTWVAFWIFPIILIYFQSYSFLYVLLAPWFVFLFSMYLSACLICVGLVLISYWLHLEILTFWIQLTFDCATHFFWLNLEYFSHFPVVYENSTFSLSQAILWWIVGLVFYKLYLKFSSPQTPTQYKHLELLS